MQGIAVGHGGAQGWGPLPVQRFESLQQAIAPLGHGTVRGLVAPPGQVGAHFPALAVAVIARQAHPRDQVIPVELSRGASAASYCETATGRDRHCTQCLRTSHARTLPVARVASFRVLLFCVPKRPPHAGQRCGPVVHRQRPLVA